MEMLQLSFLKIGISPKDKRKALVMAPFFMLLSCLIVISGCEKPAINHFYGELKTDQYGFDSYIGEREFQLDTNYNIPYSDINELSISSTDLSTGAISNVSAILIESLNLSNTDTLIILFHGAQGNLDYYYSRIKLLRSLSPNYSVLAFDYQGIGKSDGVFSLENMINDAHEVLGWVANRTTSSTTIIPVCIGLGAAAFMPNNTVLDSVFSNHFKVIMENPAAHSDFLVSNAVQFNLPGNYLLSERFDNLSLAPIQKGSLEMILSEQDEQFNMKDNGIPLFERYRVEKRMTKVPGASHHDVPIVFGLANYNSLLNQFIRR